MNLHKMRLRISALAAFFGLPDPFYWRSDKLHQILPSLVKHNMRAAMSRHPSEHVRSLQEQLGNIRMPSCGLCSNADYTGTGKVLDGVLHEFVSSLPPTYRDSDYVKAYPFESAQILSSSGSMADLRDTGPLYWRGRHVRRSNGRVEVPQRSARRDPELQLPGVLT